MSLTSPALVLVVAVIALAGLISAVLDVPRPGRRWLLLATRTLRLVVVNALVVVLAALALNNQYLFYTSWSDLFTPGESAHVQTIGDAARVYGAKVSGLGLSKVRTPSVLPALPMPGARDQTYSVTDPSTGGASEVRVILPAGYDPAGSRTYPVVLGLHGFPAVPESFVKTGITTAIDQAVAGHALAAPIIVIPQISNPKSLDTECVNGGVGEPQTETWLAKVIPTWVVQHFRVRTDRSSWVTVGYSLGGWCAAMLGMRHPDVFGGVVDFQGYFRPDFSADYLPTGVPLEPYDLVRLEERHPVPVAMFVQTSKDDSLSYPSTAQFLRAVKAPTAVTATILATGGHRVTVWDPFIAPALTWLAKTVPGFHV